jgi:hypothetical protein
VAQDASESGLGVITRRMFVGGLASVRLPRKHLVLEAIAAERMPHHLVVSGVEPSPFFEVRDYATASPELHAILVARGRALRLENGKFLFSFDSLASRERTWREMSANPEWIAMRQNAAVNEIALYRTL